MDGEVMEDVLDGRKCTLVEVIEVWIGCIRPTAIAWGKEGRLNPLVDLELASEPEGHQPLPPSSHHYERIDVCTLRGKGCYSPYKIRGGIACELLHVLQQFNGTKTTLLWENLFACRSWSAEL